MVSSAFGHALETVNDGLTVFIDGRAAPIPLVETHIDVVIRSGLATMTTRRRFRNAEAKPIEALLTLPVGFHSVVTGLRAQIDGRKFLAVAKDKEEARSYYEAALEEGRLTVLHEELLRGIHMLSVGNLAPGKEVDVEIEAVSALTIGAGGPFLQIPVTAGQLYGSSPFSSSDELTSSESVRHEATLTVSVDEGVARLFDHGVLGDGLKVPLDAAIEIVVDGGSFGTSVGRAADGRCVQVDLRPMTESDRPLDLSVLVDHSGSTGSPAGKTGKRSIWEAMRDGLRSSLIKLRNTDRIQLWEFDTSVHQIGSALGAEAVRLTDDLSGPRGGTELGKAVRATLETGVTDVLVLTDGQTWAATVDDLMRAEARVSAILVGSNSLDAMIGQLCASTGGQLFYAPGDDVSTPLVTAFQVLRAKGSAVTGEADGSRPLNAQTTRGGVEIKLSWSDATEEGAVDAVGRFAAALAVPLLNPSAAEQWARDHTLCTHRTSLVLVDDAIDVVAGMAQMRKVPLMAAAQNVDLGSSILRLRIPRSEGSKVLRSVRKVDFSASCLEQSLMADQVQKTVESPASRGVQSAVLVILFDNFPWDEQCDLLLAGDMSHLNAPRRRAVLSISERVDVKAFASITGLAAETVALGLIADLMGDKRARRFAWRVFNGQIVETWHPLRL